MGFLSHTFKVIAIGNPGVGMNTLFKKSAIEVFPNEQIEKKIGVDFYIKSIKRNNVNWEFQIWKIGNDEEQKRFLLPAYCEGASGAFFVFDITNLSTFEHVYEWFDLMNKNREFTGLIMLIGNKTDLEHEREVKLEQAKETCKELGFSRYIECRSLTGNNIEEMYEKMLEDILKKISQSQ